MTHLSRFLYRCLVQLHPPAFRRQFAQDPFRILLAKVGG